MIKKKTITRDTTITPQEKKNLPIDSPSTTAPPQGRIWR